jgi:hypothetical protein
MRKISKSGVVLVIIGILLMIYAVCGEIELGKKEWEPNDEDAPKHLITPQ